MPLLEHSIGEFEFVSLTGNVPGYREQIERITRRGFDNAIYRKTGKMSGQFTLTSTVDVADIIAGRELFNQYTELIGGELQDLVYRGYKFTDTDELKVAVLNVDQTLLRNTLLWCGGLNENSKGTLQAAWTLEFRKVVA